MLDTTGGRPLSSFWRVQLEVCRKKQLLYRDAEPEKDNRENSGERFQRRQDANLSTCQRFGSIFIDGGFDRRRPGRFP
jgi:hypothetical protein